MKMSIYGTIIFPQFVFAFDNNNGFPLKNFKYMCPIFSSMAPGFYICLKRKVSEQKYKLFHALSFFY